MSWQSDCTDIFFRDDFGYFLLVSESKMSFPHTFLIGRWTSSCGECSSGPSRRCTAWPLLTAWTMMWGRRQRRKSRNMSPLQVFLRASWYVGGGGGGGSGDSSVVGVPDSWLKGRRFESLQEQWENFLLQGQLSVLTFISVSVPPPCDCSSM